MNAETTAFTPQDEAQLARRGLDVAEAARQLRQMAAPPAWARLDRPCTVGDGIVRLGEARIEALLARHAAARAAGRVTAFVPASGAATRMFRELALAAELPGELLPAEVEAAARAGNVAAAALHAFGAAFDRFAFRDELAAHLAARGLDAARLQADGPWRPLLVALLGEDALDYARRPKALLPFHRTAAGVRTAFEEHLAEAPELVGDAQGTCRLHFTVSSEHRAGFEALDARVRAAAEARLGVRYELGFSEQHPATDTLALDDAGAVVRASDGTLLFRPAGHGALLRNLGELAADLVFIKNVDNVSVDRIEGATALWSRVLVGFAAELAAEAHALAGRLDDTHDETAVADAARFAHAALGEHVQGAERAALAALLARPVRVCGMVPNTGEPGGGPFWVRGEDGRVTRQIVESAQVAPEGEQQALLGRATHFNPVFLAAALRDAHGRPWDLEHFVDARAAIVTRKSAGGRELRALERPGLWNGAMAHWNTVFVEVPLAVFNPVKSVLDLLRPEHQG